MKRRILIFVLILLVLYPASYLALLNPQISVTIHAQSHFRRDIAFRGMGVSPNFGEVVYKPLIALDHWIRPEYWEWTQ